MMLHTTTVQCSFSLSLSLHDLTKGRMLLRSFREAIRAIRKAAQATNYGRSPSEEQMKGAGGTCPICYDSFREPVLLHCR